MRAEGEKKRNVNVEALLLFSVVCRARRGEKKGRGLRGALVA